jgi:hypothetical protein
MTRADPASRPAATGGWASFGDTGDVDDELHRGHGCVGPGQPVRALSKDREGKERFGQVVRLNTKTASVQVGTVRRRVDYGLLAPVIDGALGDLVDDALALQGVWSEVES